MKRLFNIVMMFIALALSLLIEPNAIQAQPIDSIGYIQNVKQETVVLASNSLLGGEIYSNQEEENQNFSGNSPLLVSYISKKEFFSNLDSKGEFKLNNSSIKGFDFSQR